MAPPPTKDSWATAIENKALVQSTLGAFLRSNSFATKLDRDDLLQAGMMAAEKAARYYDPDRGVKFSSYAVRAIREVFWHEAHRQQTGKPKPPRGVSVVSAGLAYEDDGSETWDPPYGCLARQIDEASAIPSAEDEFLQTTDDAPQRVAAALDALEADIVPGKRPILSREMIRRIRRHVMHGVDLQTIADDDGCSVQSVSESILLGLRKFRAFLEARGVAA